jgi:hypothetical protein
VIIPAETRDYIAVAIGTELVLKVDLMTPIPPETVLVPYVRVKGVPATTTVRGS